MSFRFNPCNPCCGKSGISFTISVFGNDPCNLNNNVSGGIVYDRKIFGGEIKTSVSYKGQTYYTGGTFTKCMGKGDYTFNVTSSNPHLKVTPSSITVTTSRDDCYSLVFSPTNSFKLIYDYWSPPYQEDIGFNELSIICDLCECSLNNSVNVNFSGDFTSSYLISQCPYGPGTIEYIDYEWCQSKSLSFRQVDGLALEFQGIVMIGPQYFTAPSWGFYSDDLVMPEIKGGGCPGFCGLPVDSTSYYGKYILGCAGSNISNYFAGGLTLYLLLKGVSHNNFSINGECVKGDSSFLAVWPIANFPVISQSSCEPLFIEGIVLPTAAPTPSYKQNQQQSVILTA